MNVVLKDAAGKFSPDDLEGFTELDGSVIIHHVDPVDLSVYTEKLNVLKIEHLCVDQEVLVEEQLVYLVTTDYSFSYDGKRIYIQDVRLPQNFKELVLNNYSQGAITLVDARLNILFTSGAGYLDHGVDPATLVGINLEELWPSEEYHKLVEQLDVIREGELHDFLVEYDRKVYTVTVTSVQADSVQYYLVKSDDSTRVKATENALRESEKRSRYFLDMSQEIICTHHSDGQYKLVSPAVKRLLGYEPEELIGKHPYDFIHPDDVSIYRQQSITAPETGKRPDNMQFRARSKDGQYIWVDSYIDFITNDDNEVTSFITASRDITDLKAIEIELRKSEERFRGIADNLPGVIYLCLNDERYSMMYLNDQVSKLTGFNKDVFVEGKVSFVDLYHPLDAPDVFEKVDEALRKKEPFRLTYRLRNVELDDWIWVEEYGQGIYEDDELVALEGVILDITTKVEDQQKLELSEANLKAIFESTQSIIALFDENNILLEFNNSFRNIIQASRNIELERGMHVSEFIIEHKVEEYLGYHKRALKGEKVKITTQYPTPNGDLHLLSSLNPIYTKGKINGVSLFVEDITELKESERQLEMYAEDLEKRVVERTKELQVSNADLLKGNEQLEAALAELQEAQNQLIQAEKMASLGVMSSGIAHEINNPLNFVKNGAIALFHRIEEMEGYSKDEMEPYFELIEQGVERVAKIVKSLSHFSRQVKSMGESCDLATIVDNCLLILNNKLNERVEVIKNMDTGCIVEGNEGKLHQAILNLLSNAEQSIDGRGLIKVELKSVGGMIELIIEDTGVGISEENLLKIGDPFFTTKPPGEGTGLGLFIAYSIIEEHRGKIEVSSIVKKGTKIRIEFPNS